MRSLRRRLRLAAVIAGFGLLAAGAAVHAREVTLTGDPWPPYVIGTLGEDAQAGIAVDLVRRIFERIEGVSPRFPLIPWARALHEVELGAMDGIVVLLNTPERNRYMIFTDPLITARSLVWYDAARHDGKFGWSDIADLKPYTIGVVRDYSYGPDIERAAKSGALKLVEVDHVDQLFSMLAHGHIDLVFANDSVGFDLARKHASEARILAADRETAQDVYHIGISRRSGAADLVPRINEVIAELRREGVIDAVTLGN